VESAEATSTGWTAARGRRRPPVIMGHEAAGSIAEIGAGVEGWKEGDRVTFDSTIYWGTAITAGKER